MCHSPLFFMSQRDSDILEVLRLMEQVGFPPPSHIVARSTPGGGKRILAHAPEDVSYSLVNRFASLCEHSFTERFVFASLLEPPTNPSKQLVVRLRANRGPVDVF